MDMHQATPRNKDSRTTLRLMALLLVLLMVPAQSQAGSFMNKLKTQTTKIRRSWEDHWSKRKSQWSALKGKLQARWNVLQPDERFRWLDQSEDRSSYVEVDYEGGVVEIGAISPGNIRNARETLRRRLRQLLVNEEDGLGGQFADDHGRPLAARDLDRYIDHAMTRVAIDGPRDAPEVARVRVDLLPAHSRIRAMRYEPLVARYASVYDVPPALALAIMQTESAFNPRAVSSAGAFGLMQIVPETGGMDASRRVYGRSRRLSREKLFDPEVNIEMGIAYLSTLQDTFESQTSDPMKLQMLVVASYNCGPQRVLRILGGRDVTQMRRAELRRLLDGRVPAETRGYLAKVTARVPQFRSLEG